MKIKELEYSELKTSNYNNYRVGARVELEEGEDEKSALSSLKEFVRKELAKAIVEKETYYANEIKGLKEEVKTLEKQIDVLEKEKNTLIEEVIERIRGRFNEIWR